VVFAEMTTGLWLTPDAIGWHVGWSILVEAKVSRRDFRADRKKLIHNPAFAERCPGQERWYLTPEGLVTSDEVPGAWGLLEVQGRRVVEVKPAARRERTPGVVSEAARHRAEMTMLLSAIARHEQGVAYDPKTARFAAFGPR